jgi:hypothetical protein
MADATALEAALKTAVDEAFAGFVALGAQYVEVEVPHAAGLVTSDMLERAIRKAGPRTVAEVKLDPKVAKVESVWFEYGRGSRLLVTQIYRP